jgi:hypothetical protein
VPATVAGDWQIHNDTPHFYSGPVAGQHNGVPLDVDILTRRGWVAHDHIVVGDETLGFNFDTGQTEWTPITAVNRFEDAEVFEAGNNRGWTVRATAGHRWITQHGPHGNYRVTTTLDRTQDSWLVAAPMADGPGIDVTNGEAELLGWLMTDGSQWGATTPCSFDGCGAYARSYGLCGSHRRQQRTGKQLHPLRHHPHRAAPDFSLFIWQSKPKGQQRLRFLLGAKAGFNGRGFRLHDAYAHDLLRRAGLTHIKNADELLAVLPRMTTAQRQLVLGGVISGDGTPRIGKGDPVADATSGRANRWKILQDEGPLLDVMATLAYLCGYRVRATKRSFSDGQKRNGVNMCLWLASPRVSTYRREQRRIGRMPVWYPTTKLGSWTARAGHSVFLSMNSHVR